MSENPPRPPPEFAAFTLAMLRERAAAGPVSPAPAFMQAHAFGVLLCWALALGLVTEIDVAELAETWRAAERRRLLNLGAVFAGAGGDDVPPPTRH